MFVQTGERLQSHRVEECISCDIEILNIRPPLNETTTQIDPELLNTPSSSASQSSLSSLSPSCEPLQADYCSQLATALWDTQTLQETTCIANKTYFNNMEEDLHEPLQVASSEIPDLNPLTVCRSQVVSHMVTSPTKHCKYNVQDEAEHFEL